MNLLYYRIKQYCADHIIHALNNILEPELGVTLRNNIADKHKQCGEQRTDLEEIYLFVT